MAVIEGLLALLCCQLVGEVLARVLPVPVPGPVLGMLLLLALLTVAPPRRAEKIMPAADRLLDLLPLLFVPAGVGVVTVLPLIAQQWVPVTVGLVLPWAAGLVTTALAAGLVARRREPAEDPEDLA